MTDKQKAELLKSLDDVLDEFGHAIVNHPEASRESHKRTYIRALLALYEQGRIEARADGIEYVLSVLHSEEGRLRQVANTVFYAAEYLSELRGEKPIPLEEFGSYKNYLTTLLTKRGDNT